MKRRRAVKESAPLLLAAVDRSKRLSEGGLIQASVRGRLLGIPLLRLDATVALLPATIGAPSSGAARDGSLAEAVRRINEGEEVLAQVRRDSRTLSLRRPD